MGILPIEKAIVKILKDNFYVSTLVDDRIYAHALPHTVILPAITYARVSTYRIVTHDQTSRGLATPRFQFNLYGKSVETCKALSLAVREAFLGYKGDIIISDDSVSVQSILPDGEIDVIEAGLDLYYTIVDYRFSHNE